MKSNKLIAFLCSAAIAATSISGVLALAEAPAGDALVVSAETIEKGYNLVFDSENSTATEKFISVYAVGYEAVKTGSVSFEVPDDVASKITSVAAVEDTGLFPTVTITELETIKESKFIGGAFAAAKPQTSADMLLFKLDIKLSEDIAEDWTLSVMDDATIEDAKGEYYYDESAFGVQSDTVTAYATATAEPAETTAPASATPTAEPTPKPTEIVIERKTPTPATEGPTAEPTKEPVVTDAPVENGYKIVFDSENSTATNKIVSVYAVGYEAVKTGSISFELTDDVASKITAVAAAEEGLFPTVTITELETIKESKFIGGAFAAAKPQTSADMLLFKLDIKLSEDIAEDWTLSVMDDATIEDAKGEYYYDESAFGVQSDTVTAYATATAEPVATTVPTEKPFAGDDEVAIKDLVQPKNPENVAGVYVKVTKNGKDAEYDKDYVAVLDGKQLTEEEFDNVKNGLTPDGTAYEQDVVKNIINKLSVKAVNGTSIEMAPSYLNEDGQLVTDPEEVATEEVATDAPVATPTTRPTTRPTDAPRGNGGGGGSSRGSTIASGTNSGTSSGGGVATAPMSFNDIDTVPWAVMAINALAGNGIVNGTSDTTFEPLAPVTRAQFTKMVCAAFSVAPIDPATARFTDVSQADWFYGYVEAAAAAGVVNGVSDTEFDPNALITREQMAAMMYRAMIATNASVQSGAAQAFTDAASISGYAVEAVNALSASGVINGMDDGSFAPKEIASRAQAACIIFQYFQSLVR